MLSWGWFVWLKFALTKACLWDAQTCAHFSFSYAYIGLHLWKALIPRQDGESLLKRCLASLSNVTWMLWIFGTTWTINVSVYLICWSLYWPYLWKFLLQRLPNRRNNEWGLSGTLWRAVKGLQEEKASNENFYLTTSAKDFSAVILMSVDCYYEEMS